MVELGNACKDREMTDKIGGEGSIEKKSIIYCGFDTSLNNSKFDFKNPANLPFSYDIWIAWLKLSNEDSPFPRSGISK